MSDQCKIPTWTPTAGPGGRSPGPASATARPPDGTDPGVGRAARLTGLRQRLAAIAPPAWPIIPTGLAPIDACLARGGLGCGQVHAAGGRIGPATRFATVVAGWIHHRHPGRIVWIAAAEPPGCHALAAAGIDSRALLLLALPGHRDRLWAFEETLRCPDVAVALAELDRVDLTAGRRLALAAEAGGTGGVIIPPPTVGRASAAASTADATDIAPTAAVTQWRITAHPSAPADDAAMPARAAGPTERRWGGRRWEWVLERSRGGRPGAWLVEATTVETGHAPSGFRVVSPLLDRPADRDRSPAPRATG